MSPEEGWVVSIGDSGVVERSQRFQAGDVRMWLERVGTALPERTDAAVPPVPVRWQRGLLARVAAGVLCVAVLGSAALALASQAEPPRVQPPATALAAPLKSGIDLVRARTALLAQMEQRGLATVKVETTPEGSQRASGLIAPHEAAAWQDVKRWADAAFGGGVLLVDNVAVGAKPAALAIQSAWLGETPYVIDGAGDKLFVGAMVDGWTIEAIESGRVLLRRQAQRTAVRF